MACFATPYGLRYVAHCYNRAYAQNNRSALIPAGGKLGVTSTQVEQVKTQDLLILGLDFAKIKITPCLQPPEN